MTPRSQVFVFSTIAVTASIAVIAVFARASTNEVHAAAAELKPVEPKASTGLIDAPIAAYRSELLSIAFNAASALPTQPHVKNRCRMQESVVETCLAIEQPRRALSNIEKIDNWRRGSAYADLALYLTQHDQHTEVAKYLELADQVAEQPADLNAQEWPKERIKSMIAAVLMKGDKSVESVDYDARVLELDGMVAHGGLEETQAAIDEFTKLYEHHYADESRRSFLHDRIRSSWSKSPIQIRFETLLKLAQTAVDHADKHNALELTKEAAGILAPVDCSTEDRIQWVAKLVDSYRRSGDPLEARKELEAALSLYDTHASDIVDIYRARSLRVLAEQFDELGEQQQSLLLYSRAVEAGVANPNSRPRADDLVATCCSMAKHEVDPGPVLTKRLREIQSSLGTPW